MPLLGAHMSIAGGYYKAVEAAAALGMNTCQIFTKNNNQWRAKEISPAEAARFRQAVRDSRMGPVISHVSYLINLAAPGEELWRRSVEAMVVELERAECLGAQFVVTHPGAFTTSSEQEGLARIVQALDEIHERTAGLEALCLLENTAGQGSCLGWSFEQLAAILDRVKQPQRLGICFDTCHAFAAGYSLAPAREYRATWRRFDELIGVDRIRVLHLNDSQRELGSRVDRHAHIGEGKMGLEPFRLLLCDRRFAGVPMCLETPKGGRDGRDWDAINLETLRRLLARTG